MKINLGLMAACTLIFAPTMAAAFQPASTATDPSSTQAPSSAPKAAPDKAAPDATCSSTVKDKVSAKNGPSAARSESVKNITRDTGIDQSPPKPKKTDTTSAASDCPTQSQ